MSHQYRKPSSTLGLVLPAIAFPLLLPECLARVTLGCEDRYGSQCFPMEPALTCPSFCAASGAVVAANRSGYDGELKSRNPAFSGASSFDSSCEIGSGPMTA